MPARESVVAGSADIPQPRYRHAEPNCWLSDAVALLRTNVQTLQYPPGPSSPSHDFQESLATAPVRRCNFLRMPWRIPRRPIAVPAAKGPEADTVQHDRLAKVHRCERCHGIGRYLPCVLYQGTVSLIPSCTLFLQLVPFDAATSITLSVADSSQPCIICLQAKLLLLYWEIWRLLWYSPCTTSQQRCEALVRCLYRQSLYAEVISCRRSFSAP